MGAGWWSQDAGITKKHQGTLGVMDVFVIVTVIRFSQVHAYSKLIKLNSSNMHTLSYADCPPTRLLNKALENVTCEVLMMKTPFPSPDPQG